MNMVLPKPKKKKLIKTKEFLKVAEKVKVSLKEEADYLREKKNTYGDKLSSHLHYLSQG